MTVALLETVFGVHGPRWSTIRAVTVDIVVTTGKGTPNLVTPQGP